MSGSLDFIKSSSGSSVSSLSVTDCFSADYDTYKITITKLDQTATNYIEARFIDTTGIDSTANYNYASLEMLSGAGFTTKRGSGDTKFETSISYQGTETYRGVGITMYVFNPYSTLDFTSIKSQSAAHYSSSSIGYKMIGIHKVNERITGINFFPRSGTLDNMTVNIYGLKVE